MSCEYCGGPLVQLGTLGRLMHVRCRSCGAYYSVAADTLDAESDDAAPVVQQGGI